MTAALSLPATNLRVPAGSRAVYTFLRPPEVVGSGWSGRGQVKPHPSSALVYWAIPSSAIVLGEDEVTLIVPAPVSRLWAWSTGVYLLELVPTTGDSVRVARGHMVVDPWPIGVTPTPDPDLDPVSGSGLFPPFYPPQYPSSTGG